MGGHPVNITDHPHQVSLQSYGHVCGGSIIAPQWILTAAHCIYASDLNRLSIRVGSARHASGGRLHTVQKAIVHPLYDPWLIDFDFALLKLAAPIAVDEVAQPIGLFDQGEEVAAGSEALVTGWGNTQTWEESQELLRGARVPIVDQRDCAEAYESFGGITDRMICAGYTEGGRDACQGDSGGPLVVDDRLVGIVSWGYGCARPNYPGVYSRVSAARDWVRSKSGV